MHSSQISAEYGALWGAVLRRALATDSPVAADLVALCDESPPSHLVGRYGDTFRAIAVAIARGDAVSPDAALARLDRQRRRWLAAALARDAAERKRHTKRTERLPWKGPRVETRPRSPAAGGIPSGPIGDPEVATHGNVGIRNGPGEYARHVAADRAGRAIDRARARSSAGTRPGNARAGSGYRTASGAYVAGRKPRRRKRR